MTTYKTMTEAYNNTMKNCYFYEKNKMEYHLANEIGVLRGIAYCLELAGVNVWDDVGMLHFIRIQNDNKENRED